MIGSVHRMHARSGRLQRQVGRGFLAFVALFLIVGSTSIAAAHAFGGGGGAGKFAATFEARAVGDPTIASCPAIGPDGQKVEGRYRGTMTIDGGEYGIHFTLEALVDRAAGLGSVEGRWQMTDPRTADVLARGELIGVVVAGDPRTETTPPDPDLELQGLFVGTVNPPDPEMPALRLLGNFTASLGDGATFPHLKGTVGDPNGVGDPTDGELLPAVLVAAEGC